MIVKLRMNLLVRIAYKQRYSVVSVVGEEEIPGLTDKTVPRRLGPKRASRIRKLFNLGKDDDVRQYVVRRPLPPKEGRCSLVIFRGKVVHTTACALHLSDLPKASRVWGVSPGASYC